MAIFLCPVDCTHSGDEDAIEIWEFVAPDGQEASNQCLWRWGYPRVPPTPPTQNCTSLAFGRDCHRITGQVHIRFAMTNSWNIGSAQSRMEEYLQNLGIGNVTEITSDLTIENVGLKNGVTLALKFFTKLQRVAGLTVLGSTQNIPGDANGYFVGMAGMMNLEQTKALTLNNTSLGSFSDFSGLRCVGGMQLLNNPWLSALDELDNVRLTMEGPGTSVLLKGNRKLKPPQLSGLRMMAGCEGRPLAGGNLFIDTACPDPISSWPALCRVVQLLACNPPPSFTPPTFPDGGWFA
jgi:hypothetical protein